MTDKEPLFFEREPVSGREDLPLGITVAYRDIRIINESNQSLSLEFKLHIWVRDRFSYSLDQTSVRSWDALKENDNTSRVIGPRLPEVIEVGARAVRHGSLAFFVPRGEYDGSNSVLALLKNRFPGKDIPTIVAEDLPKSLEVIDHLSGRRDQFNASSTFAHKLWRKEGLRNNHHPLA